MGRGALDGRTIRCRSICGVAEERNELSLKELCLLSATIAGVAATISGFFASRHSSWERLLAAAFISLAVATFLIAMWTAAKTLLPVSRRGQKPGPP